MSTIPHITSNSESEVGIPLLCIRVNKVKLSATLKRICFFFANSKQRLWGIIGIILMSLFSVQPLLTESGIHNRFRDLCAVHPELRNDTGIIVNLQPHGVGITFNLIPPTPDHEYKQL